MNSDNTVDLLLEIIGLLPEHMQTDAYADLDAKAGLPRGSFYGLMKRKNQMKYPDHGKFHHELTGKVQILDPYIPERECEMILKIMAKTPNNDYSKIKVAAMSTYVRANPELDIEKVKPCFMPDANLLILPMLKEFTIEGVNVEEGFFFSAGHEFRHIDQWLNGHLATGEEKDGTRAEMWMGKEICTIRDMNMMFARSNSEDCAAYNNLPWEQDANAFAYGIVTEYCGDAATKNFPEYKDLKVAY